jgi:hypothetical protein
MNKRMYKPAKRWIPALLAASMVASVPVAAATLTVGKASIQRLFVEGVFNKNGRWYLQDGVCYAYLESPRTWLAGGRVHIEAHLSSQLGVEMGGTCAGNALAAKVEMSGRLVGAGTTLSLADVRVDRIDDAATGSELDVLQALIPAPPPLDVLKAVRDGLADSGEVPISVDKLSIGSVTTSDADVTVQFDFALRAP